MRSLACLLVFVAAVTAQSINDVSKTSIVNAYDKYVESLKEALEGAHPSNLVYPLHELKLLKNAAIHDLGYIPSFGDGPNVQDQLDLSVKFWSGKFHDVVSPYIQFPGNYKYRIVDYFSDPKDPTWNATQAYKEVEGFINGHVENTHQHFTESYKKQLKKIVPRVVEDATYYQYAKYRLEKLLEDAKKSVTHYGHYAKYEAASGDGYALTKFQKAIRDRKLQFDRELQDIYREYESSINI